MPRKINRRKKKRGRGKRKNTRISATARANLLGYINQADYIPGESMFAYEKRKAGRIQKNYSSTVMLSYEKTPY